MTSEPTAYALWIVFVVVWQGAALWRGRSLAKAPARRRAAYAAAYVVGFGLLFTPAAGATVLGAPAHGVGSVLPTAWRTPLWTSPPALAWLLVVGEAASFGIAGWARLHLGRLWSGMITLREGHRVVDTGPYRWVRHPIYTGFIGAAWALALIEGTAVSLLGAAAVALVMAIKAKDEEGFLRRELGAAAYDAYAARTPMLAPFRLP